MPEQLILDFGENGSQFIWASIHEEMRQLLEKRPEMIIIGEGKSGKSSLLNSFGESIFDLASATMRLEKKPNTPLLVDDADIWLKEAEEVIFHLFNHARLMGLPIIFVASLPQSHWGLELADLISRLATLQSYEVTQPNDLFMEILLAENFLRKGVFVNADVVGYLSKRIERSYSSVNHAVTNLDILSRQHKKRITKQMVNEYLMRIEKR